jgi:hypothetical protein
VSYKKNGGRYLPREALWAWSLKGSPALLKSIFLLLPLQDRQRGPFSLYLQAMLAPPEEHASRDERRRVKSRLLGAPARPYVPSTPLRQLPSHLHAAIGGFLPSADMLSIAATSSWAIAVRAICLRRLALKQQPVDRLSLELRRAASTDEGGAPW